MPQELFSVIQCVDGGGLLRRRSGKNQADLRMAKIGRKMNLAHSRRTRRADPTFRSRSAPPVLRECFPRRARRDAGPNFRITFDGRSAQSSQTAGNFEDSRKNYVRRKLTFRSRKLSLVPCVNHGKHVGVEMFPVGTSAVAFSRATAGVSTGATKAGPKGVKTKCRTTNWTTRNENTNRASGVHAGLIAVLGAGLVIALAGDGYLVQSNQLRG